MILPNKSILRGRLDTVQIFWSIFNEVWCRFSHLLEEIDFNVRKIFKKFSRSLYELHLCFTAVLPECNVSNIWYFVLGITNIFVDMPLFSNKIKVVLWQISSFLRSSSYHIFVFHEIRSLNFYEVIFFL